MKNTKSFITTIVVVSVFFLMALACATSKPRYRNTKPVVYPCIQHPALTYSPILVKLNISANYTMKDLSGVRQNDPTLIMDELKRLNYNYQLADGVRPNLVLNVTYTNDGYDHFGVNLYVDWQGQGNFTITLPANYVTITQLIHDMCEKFNAYIIYGWHSGNCN